jgi:Cd2+/Zn2+-exporting ATPase
MNHLEPKSHEPHEEKSSCGSCDHDHASPFNRWREPSLWLGAAATVAGLLAEHAFKAPTSVSLFFYIVGLVAGGWFLVPEALISLWRFRPNINALVVMASVGAAIIGAWGEAAVVVVLFGTAEWLESFSVGRARKAISKLLDLAPPTARIRSGTQWTEKPLEEVVPGDVVEIRSGERIPLDAIVKEGASDVNQAPITGEPLPVEKKAGDALFAGTLNGSGLLIAEVTKPYRDSTLAKIIRLVEEAQEQRAPTQKFVERFAAVYTPLVPILSLLVFAIPVLFFGGEAKEWAYRAFTVLVIACPCALVVSTPVSIVCGLATLARKGVLVKGGAYLELLGQMRALAVDKTGTITEGRPRVLEVVPWNGKSESEILRIAASLDAKSTHPLAQAVLQHAQQKGIPLAEPTGLENLSGRGNQGMIESHRYFVGNHRLAHELNVCSPELETRLNSIQEKGRSVAIVGHQRHDQCSGEVWGILVIGDAIRPEAKEAIHAMHQAGLEELIMLSGDNQKAADAVAKEVGIDLARGDLLPEDKTLAIKDLKSRYAVVGMVGDGINDAPALASATFGIAMGAAGSDTAIETADIALMRDDLKQVAVAMRLGRRTLRIIQFNVGFALALKAVFLVLGVAGHTSLWLAILADTGATVLVVANAMRLLRE